MDLPSEDDYRQVVKFDLYILRAILDRFEDEADDLSELLQLTCVDGGGIGGHASLKLSRHDIYTQMHTLHIINGMVDEAPPQSPYSFNMFFTLREFSSAVHQFMAKSSYLLTLKFADAEAPVQLEVEGRDIYVFPVAYEWPEELACG